MRVHVTLGWSGSPVSCRDFPVGVPITIGSDAGVDVPLPEEISGGRFELVRPSPAGLILHLPPGCEVRMAGNPLPGAPYRDRPANVPLRAGVAVQLLISEMTLDVELLPASSLRATSVRIGPAPVLIASTPVALLLLAALALPEPVADLRSDEESAAPRQLRAWLDVAGWRASRTPPLPGRPTWKGVTDSEVDCLRYWAELMEGMPAESSPVYCMDAGVSELLYHPPGCPEACGPSLLVPRANVRRGLPMADDPWR